MGIVKNIKRHNAKKESAQTRISHYGEFTTLQSDEALMSQASRCMDCGVAFCNNACPLGNVLPDLNALIADGHWQKALDTLHLTNNFPEFTGRLCPGFCEASCVLGLHDDPTITKEIELSIIEKGFENQWVKPIQALIKTGKKVAVIGSGPSGLTVAQQLVREGHKVTVFEKDTQIGGIMVMGIPDYKLEKDIIDRRVDQMRLEGVVFKTNINVGVDIDVDELKASYDAICLCGGSSVPRDLDLSGRRLKGIHFAMDYLVQQNLENNGEKVDDKIDAKDKRVVIIGGGDTGADCLGVALRQGAKSVVQLELMPEPPSERTVDTPWPYWPVTLRENSAHQEGGSRTWSILTKEFVGEDSITGITCSQLEWSKSDGKMVMKEIEGSDYVLKADLVLFAMGFIHPEHEGLLNQLSVKLDKRGNVATEDYGTNQDKVFAAGDMRTGQSLICKVIADGRSAAASIHEFLSL